MPRASRFPTTPTLGELKHRADAAFAEATEALAQALQIKRDAFHMRGDLNRSGGAFDRAAARRQEP